MVDSADHSKVGPHVRLVLLRSIPTPEVALSVDRLLEEIGLRLVDCRIVERWKRHPLVFVHTVCDLGPWEMTDSGPLVSVFGVGGVEADLQAEGLFLWLLLEEIDRPSPRGSGFRAASFRRADS